MRLSKNTFVNPWKIYESKLNAKGICELKLNAKIYDRSGKRERRYSAVYTRDRRKSGPLILGCEPTDTRRTQSIATLEKAEEPVAVSVAFERSNSLRSYALRSRRNRGCK